VCVCVCDLWYDNGPGRISFIESEDQAFLMLSTQETRRKREQSCDELGFRKATGLIQFRGCGAHALSRSCIARSMPVAVQGRDRGIIYSQGTLCPRDA
jgi:hypothetical protein